MITEIIENVLESDTRLVADFKEAFDMMLSVFKRIFKDALRIDQMISGENTIKEL